MPKKKEKILAEALKLVSNAFQEMIEVVSQRTQVKLNEQEQRMQEYFRQQLQETLRQQDETTTSRLEQALIDMGDYMNVVHSLEERLQKNMRGVEERVTTVEQQLSSGSREGDGSARGNEDLEKRISILEASVQGVLLSLRRVEDLLQKQPPMASPAPTTTNTNITATVTNATTTTTTSNISTLLFPDYAASARPSEATPSRSVVQKRPEVLRRALVEAVRAGYVDGVRNLLDGGAEIDFPDAHGSTPLMHATASSHPDVVFLLLERNADVNVTDNFGNTALHLAAKNDESGRCAALLIHANISVNSRNKYGATPLHFAASAQNKATVRALLAAGADKMIKNVLGQTAFDMASPQQLALEVKK